jgi:hypothetical protein
MSKKTSKSVTPKIETPSIFHRKSSAGKGDTPRMGITLDEWEKRYEKVFHNKKERTIRPLESNNSGSES